MFKNRMLRSLAISLISLGLIAPLASSATANASHHYRHVYHTRVARRHVRKMPRLRKHIRLGAEDNWSSEYQALQSVRHEALAVMRDAQSPEYGLTRHQRNAYSKEAQKMYREADSLQSELA